MDTSNTPQFPSFNDELEGEKTALAEDCLPELPPMGADHLDSGFPSFSEHLKLMEESDPDPEPGDSTPSFYEKFDH